MTPEQAAWVRENVWTQPMRLSHEEHPGASSACACQYGQSTRCAMGVHDHCQAGGLTSCETYITAPRGYVVAFRELYNNPTPSACGGQRGNAAQVFLADRVCRWWCPVVLAKETTELAEYTLGAAAPPKWVDGQSYIIKNGKQAAEDAEPPAVPRRYEVVALPGFEHLLAGATS